MSFGFWIFPRRYLKTSHSPQVKYDVQFVTQKNHNHEHLSLPFSYFYMHFQEQFPVIYAHLNVGVYAGKQSIK